jgi:hypothetical protein
MDDMPDIIDEADDPPSPADARGQITLMQYTA